MRQISTDPNKVRTAAQVTKRCDGSSGHPTSAAIFYQVRRDKLRVSDLPPVQLAFKGPARGGMYGCEPPRAYRRRRPRPPPGTTPPIAATGAANDLHGRHQKARHGQSLRRPGSPRRPRAGARTRPGSRRVRRRRRSPPPHLPQRARRQRRPAGPRTALGRRHGRPGLEAAEPPPQEARHQPFRRHVDHREAAGRRPRRDVVPRALRPVRGALRAEQGRGKGEGCPASERHSRGRHRGIPLPHPGHGQARRPGEGRRFPTWPPTGSPWRNSRRPPTTSVSTAICPPPSRAPRSAPCTAACCSPSTT